MGFRSHELVAVALSAALSASCSVDRVFAPADGGGGDGGGQAGAPGNGGATAGNGPGGSGGVGGTGGGTGGAPPSCGTGRVCVAAPSADWQGPFVLYEGPNGTPPPACEPEYPTSLGDYLGALDEGTAACDCSCGAATNIQCTAAMDVCYNGNCLAVCQAFSGGIEQSLSPSAGCNVAPASSASKVHVKNPAPTDMGSCAPQDNPTLPTPVFTLAERICGGAASTTEGCSATELCVPDVTADFAVFCVAQSDEVACLDPFYSVRHIVAEDFDDGRGCSPCGCDAAVSTCGGEIVFASNNCSIALGSVAANNCGDNPDFASSVSYTPAPSGSCNPNGGVLSGEVTKTGVLTLCCNG